jgi:hypothetical protein
MAEKLTSTLSWILALSACDLSQSTPSTFSFNDIVEVVCQYRATTMAMGTIVVCQTPTATTTSSTITTLAYAQQSPESIMTTTSLIAINGFEFILTIMTVPIMRDGISFVDSESRLLVFLCGVLVLISLQASFLLTNFSMSPLVL